MYSYILQNVCRHATLSVEEADFFTSMLQVKKFRKKQFVLLAGEENRYEYFVTKGCLRQYYLDNTGQEHIIMFAPEDWWISDMHSFINRQPSLTTVDALEDTEVLALERNNYDTLLLKAPVFERIFRIMIQRAFVSQQRRIVENMSLTAGQRYINFTERYPMLEQRLPLRQIAYYIGITPESLSRIRAGKLKKA
jgi:CRP-like cAMP-binding protein